MSYTFRRTWFLLAVFVNVFIPANVQYAMPMYMSGYAVPAPMPIAVAIQLPEPVTKTTTTTTTTPSPNIAIAVPVPVPMPVQFAVPAHPPPVFCQGNPRPRSCPPCPPCLCTPSCTPAFFSYCSPCHLKCRCRNSQDTPEPLPPQPPIPVPGPSYPLPVPVASPLIAAPPVVVVPLPPAKSGMLPLPSRPRKKRRFPPFLTSSSSSDDSCSYESSSESDWYKRSGKKFKRRQTRLFRRSGVSSDTELVKPIMSYISESGDVKFRTDISSKEAKEILDEGDITSSHKKQSVNVNVNDDSVVVSNNGEKSGRRYNKVVLRDSMNGHAVLNNGKNKLIFKSPPHKKIDNLAVSFQLT